MPKWSTSGAVSPDATVSADGLAVEAPAERCVVARGATAVPTGQVVDFVVQFATTAPVRLPCEESFDMMHSRTPEVGVTSQCTLPEVWRGSALAPARAECALMSLRADDPTPSTVRVELDTSKTEIHVRFWLNGVYVNWMTKRLHLPREGGHRRWFPVVSLGAGQRAVLLP